MSISNLFEPNAYDLFCNSLTANIESMNTLAVNTITSNPAGGSLTIQGDTIDQTGRIIQPDTTDNRKIVMFPSVPGDSTNFFGFGVNPSALRYEVNTTASNHIFYASTGLGTDIELLRIVGNGGGVQFPSVGSAAAGQLNYYDTYQTTFTWTGPWTNQTSNVSFTRIGNTVSMTLHNSVLALVTVANQHIVSTTAIPSQYLPSLSTQFCFWLPVNNINLSQAGSLSFTPPSGVITIYAGVLTGQFSKTGAGTTNGGFYSTTITWTLS